MKKRFCILCGKEITGVSYCRECWKKGKYRSEVRRAGARRWQKRYKQEHLDV